MARSERLPGIEETSKDVFCEIIERRSPSVKVFETEQALVIMDKFGGYPLVLSKEHSDKYIPQILELAGKLIPFVKKAYHADGVRVLLNQGDAAGQEIPHPHVHIMPREKVENGVGRTLGAQDELEKQRLAKKLRELSRELIPHLNRKNI